jgi:flagellar export protein FliJ
MPFRFRLLPLLRIRAVREELERERLLLSQLRSRETENAMRGLQDRSQESRDAFLGADVAITGSQMHFFQACGTENSRAEAIAKSAHQAAQQLQESQRRRYEQAHRDCAVLEKLQERQWKQFREQEARKEQQRLDEAFTLSKGTTNPASLAQ